MNLKNSFLKHCKINKFDINQNQIKTIELLEKYYIQNFKKSLLKKIFKKILKNWVYTCLEVWA